MTALLSRQRGAGLDLAAEGERGDGLAEGLGEGFRDHVAVLGRGDPGEVGQRGVQPEDLRDLGEGEQLAELGRPAGLAVGLPGRQLRAAVIARESIPRDRARSKSVATSNWKEKRLDRASVRTAPWTQGLWPATT
jgi:hypothetical protein